MEQKNELLECQIEGCQYQGNREQMITHLVELHEFKESAARAIYKKEGHLVEAAKAAGAVPLPDEFEKTKSVKQALEGKIKFYPEFPRIEWSSLVGQTFIIKQAKIVEDWNSSFGTSDFPLFRVLLEDGRECTTLGSGVAILNQARKLLNMRLLPVKCKLTMQPGGSGEYYLLE
jgi:hypothetical protein